MTKKAIEINGADEVGKTTQAILLGIDNATVLVPPRHTFSKVWGKLDQHGRTIGHRDWWFASDNVDEFLQTMITPLIERVEYINKLPDDKIAILDRGDNMVLAALTATIRLKRNISAPKARKIVNKKYKKMIRLHGVENNQISSWSILLKAPGNIEEKVEQTLKRTTISPSDPFYKTYETYQTYLQQEIAFLEKRNKFNHVLMAENEVLNIQNTIRGKLSNTFNGVANKIGSKITKIILLRGDLKTMKYLNKHLLENYDVETLPHKFANENFIENVAEIISFIDNTKENNSAFILDEKTNKNLYTNLQVIMGEKLHVIDLPHFNEASIKKEDIRALSKKVARDLHLKPKKI